MAVSLNILVVDDDGIDVMTVKRGLKKAGIEHQFYSAENGVQALQKLRSGEIPLERLLVLLDLNMPQMNGIEFLRELRADESLSTVKVLVMSTSSQESDVKNAKALHASGYFVKPLEYPKFVEILSTMHRYWTLSQH